RWSYISLYGLPLNRPISCRVLIYKAYHKNNPNASKK
ncbi:unnamed protein product, partial [marine sediment metagenome]